MLVSQQHLQSHACKYTTKIAKRSQVCTSDAHLKRANGTMSPASWHLEAKGVEAEVQFLMLPNRNAKRQWQRAF